MSPAEAALSMKKIKQPHSYALVHPIGMTSQFEIFQK